MLSGLASKGKNNPKKNWTAHKMKFPSATPESGSISAKKTQDNGERDTLYTKTYMNMLAIENVIKSKLDDMGINTRKIKIIKVPTSNIDLLPYFSMINGSTIEPNKFAKSSNV